MIGDVCNGAESALGAVTFLRTDDVASAAASDNCDRLLSHPISEGIQYLCLDEKVR